MQRNLSGLLAWRVNPEFEPELHQCLQPEPAKQEISYEQLTPLESYEKFANEALNPKYHENGYKGRYKLNERWVSQEADRLKLQIKQEKDKRWKQSAVSNIDIDFSNTDRVKPEEKYGLKGGDAQEEETVRRMASSTSAIMDDYYSKLRRVNVAWTKFYHCLANQQVLLLSDDTIKLSAQQVKKVRARACDWRQKAARFRGPVSYEEFQKIVDQAADGAISRGLKIEAASTDETTLATLPKARSAASNVRKKIARPPSTRGRIPTYIN